MEELLIPGFLLAGLWVAWRVMLKINYYTFGEHQERERMLAERKEARARLREEEKGDDRPD